MGVFIPISQYPNIPVSQLSQYLNIPISQYPNILWINTEDISPDLGCYGNDFSTTPNLDKLATVSVLYENAYASAPICTPSRTCFITGIYGASMGTQHLRSDVKRPSFIKTFPELLKEHGYWASNYGKTDYNFNPGGIYDYQKQDLAPWRQNKDHKPFFSMFVLGMTHEGGCNNPKEWEEATRDMPGALFHNAGNVPLPVYYPDSKEIRKSWAHYYDNITAMDITVGEILDNLEKDGLKENTIIVFFSDHGAGMPRYKRWLYSTGLKVPLLIHIPAKFRQLAHLPAGGSKEKRLVSLADLTPTFLNILNLPVPSSVQGLSFAGNKTAQRKEIYGARSRADNMYETSRSVRDDRFEYIRHYMPHLPYIQPGFIFSDDKESFRELRRLRKEGNLSAEAEKMWQPKSVEELYDLQSDPYELKNLAAIAAWQPKLVELRKKLHKWMIDIKDSELLHESDYMDRSSSTTPYEFVHDENNFDAQKLLDAAEMVGKAPMKALLAKLHDSDIGVRNWAVIGIQALGKKGRQAIPDLKKLLRDVSPTVQISAAATLCSLDESGEALPVLGKWVVDKRPWIALYAARSIELAGSRAKPLVALLYKVLDNNKGTPGASLPYKDYNFAAFITWSVEYALLNCGEKIAIY